MPGSYVYAFFTLDQAGSLMAGQGASQEARKDLHEREMGRREGDDGLQLAQPRFGTRREEKEHFTTLESRYPQIWKNINCQSSFKDNYIISNYRFSQTYII